ncbi:MAG: aldo/keto reductase, partial [Clostridia bacterium]|nr:aldo/keto reductase [Clostridia bacterium]
MKKFFGTILVIIIALFGFSACTGGNPNGNDEGNGEPPAPSASTVSDVLIAYFSCTNTTEAIAEHIQTETKGTLYEIVPQVPYTADDLKYYTNCRADREQADSTARPAISGNVENMETYGVVFVGY